MRILGLDLALESTGFCVIDANTCGDVSIKLIGSTQTAKKDSRGRRLRVIFEQMTYLRDTYKPDVISLERPFSKHKTSTQALFSVLGVVQCVFYDFELFQYAVSTLKKSVTGNGWAEKAEVQDVLSKRFPDVVFANDDESDALGVAMTHLKKLEII